MANKPFSPIQNRIISKLKNAKVLRYGQLREPKVPNDLFNYHLQHLVQKKFITKTEAGYSLAAKGIKHVADPYPHNNVITSLFKVNVITIVSRKVKRGKKAVLEILNQERLSNPSYGKIGVMGGVVLKGESILDAATRKLKQETGLTAKFRFVGCERRMMYKDGELFSDLLFPIAYAEESSGNLIEHSNFGKNFWVPIDAAIKNDTGDFDTIRAIPRVLKAVKEGKIKKLPFFFTEEVQSDGEPVVAEDVLSW